MQTLTAVMEQIKLECKSEVNNFESPVLSEKTLAVLTSMLPTILNSALHILDQGKVTKFICIDSRRCFYRVQESPAQSQGEEHFAKPQSERTSSGAVYYDIMGDFCCCFFYTKQCLRITGSSLCCKHVLAAKLAEAFSFHFEDKLQIKEIPDLDFQPLFLSSKNHMAKFHNARNTQSM